jgi:hypothetical protein
LRASLDRSAEDAATIVAEAEEPLQDYKKKIKQYESTLLKIIAQAYPLSIEQRRDLDLRQRDLGLRADDAAEAPILAQSETDYQAREAEQRKLAQKREADELKKAEAAAERKRVATAKERVEAPNSGKPERPEKLEKSQKKVGRSPDWAGIPNEPPRERAAAWRLKEVSEIRLAMIDPLCGSWRR